MDARLAGRRVVVTGASSGIGRAVAEACAAAGASVAGIARRRALLDELVTEHGGFAVAADIADTSQAQEAVSACADHLGGIDAVVNAAGVIIPGAIATADPAEWKTMFDVNVLGMLAVTQAAIPHLLEAEAPSVVNVSSMSGRRLTLAELGTYAATKFAVHVLGDALRMELQPQGVRVTTLAPGIVATGIFDDRADSGLEGFARLTQGVGMVATDVAEVVVHTLSAPASVTMVEVALVPTAQVRDGARDVATD